MAKVTKDLHLKSIGVSPEVHRQLKELQRTKYGEVSMNWVIAELLNRNEGRMIASSVEKRETQQ